MPNPEKVSPAELEGAVAELKSELQRLAGGAPARLDCSPETIEQGLARLVLGLVELLRLVLERQAVRRMEAGSLTDVQIEEMGQALMKLEQKVQEIGALFGLRPEDLRLDLGPLGRVK